MYVMTKSILKQHCCLQLYSLPSHYDSCGVLDTEVVLWSGSAVFNLPLTR